MAKTSNIKKTDSSYQVQKDEVRKNRLQSIKHQLESGGITSFDQVFAIMSETRISIELGMAFLTMRRKVLDPGEFTINEIIRLASLIGVKYDTMANWLRDRIKEKSKSKIFRE